MKKPLLLTLVILAAALSAAGCQPALAPTAAPGARTPTGAPVDTRPAWQRDWDKTLVEAKKEGKVSLYTTWPPAVRQALTESFKNKYGINLEFTPFSRGGEAVARAQTEQRAGLYAADIFGSGIITLLATAKPTGILGSTEPLLILPEVTDPKNWTGGAFPFSDKDKTTIAFISSIQRLVVYNTNMVGKNEITSYRDLLKPQYKGKITLNDPTVTGVGNGFMASLARQVWNLEEAKSYLRQLIREQELVIQRDNRTHVESVARGKFAIGLAPSPEMTDSFFKMGAPLEMPILKEPTFISPAAGAVTVAVKLANPNATRVFLNWLLTSEGQTVFSRSFGNPSLRTDVSTEGFHPIFLPHPGEKFLIQDEEFTLFMGEMQGIARDVIAEAIAKK